MSYVHPTMQAMEACGAELPSTQLSEAPEPQEDRSGGIAFLRSLGPIPDADPSLQLNENYIQLVRDCRELSDQNNPRFRDASSVAKRLCKHWLDDLFDELDKEPRYSVALACAKFGIQADELPFLERFDAIYRFHSGIIGAVYEICERASLIYTEPAKAGKKRRRAAAEEGPRARRRPRSSSGAGEGDDAVDDDEAEECEFRAIDPPEAPVPDNLKRRTLLTQRLFKAIEVCFHLWELLRCSFRVYLSASPQEPVSRPVNDYDLLKFSHLQFEHLNPHQRLYHALSRHFVLNRYRRSGDRVCEERMITINKSLYHSHYWKPGRLIRKVIVDFCDKSINGAQWVNLTASNNNLKNAVEWYTAGNDKDLGRVHMHRRCFGFTNGILFMGTEMPGYTGPPIREDGMGAFFRYGGPPPFNSDAIPMDLHCCRFFEMEFPEDTIEILNNGEDILPYMMHFYPRPVDAREDDGIPRFPTIWPTPLFDSIFERQDYRFFEAREPDFLLPGTFGSLFQIYGMMGRLLYAVNELDNYQVALFFLGVAGTGKSIVCKTMSSLYDEEAVGTMSAGAQETFALAPYYRKLLIVMPEVKAKMGLQPGDFQSMTSGEGLSLNVKYGPMVVLQKWKTQLLMAGNDTPAWADALGALFRRLLCIAMNKTIPDSEVDPTLQDRILKTELVFILLKIHTCYRLMVAWGGKRSFWDFACQDFQTARRKLELELNPMKKFVLSAESLRRDSDEALADGDYTCYIFYERLMALFTTWCKTTNIRNSMSGTNRGQHEKKVLDDCFFRLCTGQNFMLPTEGVDLVPTRTGLVVLGISEVNNPLMLEADWASRITDPG